MNEVKWIKIVTDIFDDEKMLLIDSLPEKDAIIVIWFKLLCLAGKQNNGGVFMFNDRIAYTDEMFATIFRRPLNTVRLALKTFEEYGMIEIVNKAVTVPKWEKHQKLETLENAREQTRKRVEKHRQKQKEIACNATCNVTDGVTVTQCNADRLDIDEIRLDNISPNGDIYSESGEAPAPKKPVKHKYGEYSNVLLSDEELEKLRAEISNVNDYIERLSSYIASTGKVYKSHYATIRNWYRKDMGNKPKNAIPEPSDYIVDYERLRKEYL